MHKHLKPYNWPNGFITNLQESFYYYFFFMIKSIVLFMLEIKHFSCKRIIFFVLTNKKGKSDKKDYCMQYFIT